ncbi:isoleucine--tRNA ligase, partial [Candidatus Parcubacteria bacterium]|nr:isoleucine--tRNA ligase [Candidatus Parcubacteria bacterium]
MASKNKSNNKNVNPFPKMEEEVLNFWDKAKIFKKSVNKEAPQGDYVFYDGPPFGTGEPHYGHLLSSISKDVVPRYWTMRGYRVERRWGWDCHGLPIENIIEKDKKISGKKEIEKMGVDRFNEACRARVLEYADIWDKMIHRIGRWVEFKNSYKTMDLDYMESVWWGFSRLWKKDLIYQGRKVLLYCPRCETPISNFEVAMDNSYQEIIEPSVYVKFRIANPRQLNANLRQNDEVYILAWTTTPWTLPGNVALAVGTDIDYVMVKHNDEFYVLAKGRLEEVFKDKEHELINTFKGKELIGLEYEPLFDVPALRASGKKVYYIAPADFVTTEDGTGVVHIAVVYGEDDYNLGLKLGLPVIPALDEKGYFNETVPQFKGVYFKDADKKIIKDLEKRGLLFAKVDYKHPYPFCHRCETQLFYNAIPAWFLNISKIRKRMLELNKNINWFPKHLKQGRFAQGIEQAPDWNISRNRYFATPMPIWECDKCKEREVIGSIKELEDKSGQKNIKDIHNHFIDDLKWKCSKCNGTMKRISEVFDCWVESGSMFFAQMHYPFENKEKFEKNFPAQFISEYISQTRAWFYVMHVLSTALFNSNSFENVVTTGVIFAEDGSKMSKSKKNFPDPWKVINEFGVDALRFYLMRSTLMQAENLFFNERELRDVFRKNIMLVWNVYKFYTMYADKKV